MTDAPAAMTPGATLAQERQRQNLSVAEVAAKLRISLRQIEALEADQYDKLPGETFVRGFMRNYARLLGLDPEPLVLASGVGTAAPSIKVDSIDVASQNVHVASMRSRSSFGIGKALVIGVILVGLGLAAAWLWRNYQNGARSAAPAQVRDAGSVSIPVEIPGSSATASTEPAPSSTPVPSTAKPATSATLGATAGNAPASAAATGGLGVMRLEFSGDAWVELRDRNDFVIHKEPNRAGDIVEIQVRPPVAIVIGNASNVKMQFNGRTIDLAPHTKVSVARFTLSDPE